MKIFIIIVSFFILPQSTVLAKVYVVKKNTVISSVQGAINMAHAGDTIIVMSGTYADGNITINKPLVIMGEN